MKSQWNEATAADLKDPLDLRVYSSRLIGSDPTLVLHGGGNTSVKARERRITGTEERILYIKGSGWSLDTIERQGFAPLRLEQVAELASLDTLSDVMMARELKASMTNPSAPSPSVESILHAIIPEAFVDHTHADAVISVTNTPSGRKYIEEIYGSRVVVVPYVMPGFALSKVCARSFAEQRTGSTIGIILMNHGVVSFGDSAKESYERMIELVSLAEEFLRGRNSWQLEWEARETKERPEPVKLAQLRRELSELAERPMILHRSAGEQVLTFCRRDDLERVALQGPATPDHSIRTKRLPLVGRDLAAYAEAYEAYFRENAGAGSSNPVAEGPELVMLDPAPRVVLDPTIGMITAGKTASEARIVEDIYRHTIDIISRSSLLEEYRALPASDIFDVEYWSLEQQKLKRGSAPPEFEGEVALITGAASGIGRACAQKFLEAGAAVVGLDLSPSVESAFSGDSYLGVQCDVTDHEAVRRSIERAVDSFGGLDLLVLNAGIFPESRPIAEMVSDEWRRVQAINLDANQTLLTDCYPFLRLAPKGGRVVVVASKNVPAPGPGAAAYSASKAALTQLARVAALEWGNEGIRVNVVHPNAVFDTGVWTSEVIEGRARSYGLTVDEYKTKNVLGVEVASADVARVVVSLCGSSFSKTTGAQIPVDGGNERVI